MFIEAEYVTLSDQLENNLEKSTIDDTRELLQIIIKVLPPLLFTLLMKENDITLSSALSVYFSFQSFLELHQDKITDLAKYDDFAEKLLPDEDVINNYDEYFIDTLPDEIISRKTLEKSLIKLYSKYITNFMILFHKVHNTENDSCYFNSTPQ